MKETVAVSVPVILRILWFQILGASFSSKLDLTRKVILNNALDSLDVHLTSALTAPEVTELNTIVSTFNISEEDLLDYDPTNRLPTAIDLGKIVTVTLDNNPPDDWAPVGFTARTEALIINGNDKKVKIKTLIRRLPSGRSLYIVNNKVGKGDIEIEDDKGNSPTNRFIGAGKKLKIKPGAHIIVLSADILDRWSLNYGHA